MKLDEIRARLFAAGIDEARLEASLLIEHFEGVTRAAQLAHADRDYTDSLLERAVERREAREPLQYILGEWDFMGYTFKVSPDCLIPRADTELLCSLLIKKLPQDGCFADLCTGSGCIAVSALLMRPDATGTAVELYENTLCVARENARLHGVDERLRFILGDACSEVLEGKYDMIVSNPPYVTENEMMNISPEVSCEPRAALTDGADGLGIIKKIIEIYPSHIKKGGILAIEIGYLQGDAVRSIALQNGFTAEILCDFGGRDRVAVINI